MLSGLLWLPIKDLNLYRLIQSQVCYHYTNRQNPPGKCRVNVHDYITGIWQ